MADPLGVTRPKGAVSRAPLQTGNSARISGTRSETSFALDGGQNRKRAKASSPQQPKTIAFVNNGSCPSTCDENAQTLCSPWPRAAGQIEPERKVSQPST